MLSTNLIRALIERPESSEASLDHTPADEGDFSQLQGLVQAFLTDQVGDPHEIPPAQMAKLCEEIGLSVVTRALSSAHQTGLGNTEDHAFPGVSQRFFELLFSRADELAADTSRKALLVKLGLVEPQRSTIDVSPVGDGADTGPAVHNQKKTLPEFTSINVPNELTQDPFSEKLLFILKTIRTFDAEQTGSDEWMEKVALQCNKSLKELTTAINTLHSCIVAPNVEAEKKSTGLKAVELRAFATAFVERRFAFRVTTAKKHQGKK